MSKIGTPDKYINKPHISSATEELKAMGSIFCASDISCVKRWACLLRWILYLLADQNRVLQNQRRWCSCFIFDHRDHTKSIFHELHRHKDLSLLDIVKCTCMESWSELKRHYKIVFIGCWSYWLFPRVTNNNILQLLVSDCDAKTCIYQWSLKLWAKVISVRKCLVLM